MGAPFSDITLYTPTIYKTGTPEYLEERSLLNFVSDLYVQNMNGYKPPKTRRITVQPAYYGIWNQPWKNGSIAHVAPFFSYDQFSSLDKQGKYMYILDIIQAATIELSAAYNWDKEVFENAYKSTLASNFNFRIEYPAKQSKDRKKSGAFIVTKTDTVTSVYAEIRINGIVMAKKLFEKKNAWWYDCVYVFARHYKWIDSDRFGIAYGNGKIEIWYSITTDTVSCYENGHAVPAINFANYFIFN